MSTKYTLNEAAQDISAGRPVAERLYLALQIVESCDDPKDFAALDMFLGMVSEHCSAVKLDAAIKADLDAHDDIERDIPAGETPLWIGWDMAEPDGRIPAAEQDSCAAPRGGGGDAETQATTTHEQSEPVPEPGPRSVRAALASIGDAVARSDDSWFFQTLGGASLFALLVAGLFAGEIFK